MQSRYDRLWVFGDSYTTPNLYVSMSDSFWGQIARRLDISTILNCSRQKNSWTSVQHLVVGLSGQIQWDRDLVVIGVPPLERITVFDNYKDTGYIGYQIDTQTWKHQQFDIQAHRGLVCLQNYGEDKELVLHSDRGWLETNVLREIFLLTQWLDRVGASYLVLNLSKNFDANNCWGPSDTVLAYCKQLENAVLFENTYWSVNEGVNLPADTDHPWGHHGAAGNRHYFEQSVFPTLQACGLC